MIRGYNFKIIGSVFFLCVLICIGLFIYAEWDLKRFKSSLRELPEVSQAPISQREMVTKKHFEKTGPSAIVDSKRLEEQHLESKVPEVETDDLAVTELEVTTLDSFFDIELSEDILAEYIDITEEKITKMPRKQAIADYNAYLVSDPEYAYTRLADVFQMDFGDCPEVDILVESVRKANNGPLTVDEDLAWKEAILRTLPKDEYATIGMVSEMIAALKKLKELESMGGEPTLIHTKFRME